VLGLQLELELALQGLLELPLVRQQLQLPVRQQVQPLERQQLELERPGLLRQVLELEFLLPQELGLLERLQRRRR
jgi:hypothetical protein